VQKGEPSSGLFTGEKVERVQQKSFSKNKGESCVAFIVTEYVGRGECAVCQQRRRTDDMGHIRHGAKRSSPVKENEWESAWKPSSNHKRSHERCTCLGRESEVRQKNRGRENEKRKRDGVAE